MEKITNLRGIPKGIILVNGRFETEEEHINSNIEPLYPGGVEIEINEGEKEDVTTHKEGEVEPLYPAGIEVK